MFKDIDQVRQSSLPLRTLSAFLQDDDGHLRTAVRKTFLGLPHDPGARTPVANHEYDRFEPRLWKAADDACANRRGISDR